MTEQIIATIIELARTGGVYAVILFLIINVTAILKILAVIIPIFFILRGWGIIVGKAIEIDKKYDKE